jgi:hypothetical protein
MSAPLRVAPRYLPLKTMTNKTFDRLLNTACLVGIAIWIGIDWGLELWRGRYMGFGMLAGTSVTAVLMYVLYRISRKQHARDLARDLERQRQEVATIVEAMEEQDIKRPTLH